MSSDEDVYAALTWLNLINVQPKRKRRYWVHPYWRNNVCEHGAYVVFKELSTDPERFQSFYRMSKNSFDILVSMVRPEIQKKDTNFRRSICTEERLLITLRYYATGCSFKALSYYFLRGHTSIRNIVATTSLAIWNALQPEFLPQPTTQKWKEVASRYYQLWNLPHCVGSVDGKHIRIKAPSHSGSAFYNYKQFFSIVLLATTDADGIFLTIDVGEYGRNSDGRVLRESAFGKALISSQLNLPEPSDLPGEPSSLPFPYYFVGDEAFPLMENLMRPYPRRQLTNEKRIYNYRISRGRKSVECAFGMLVSKFRILETPISCKIETVDVIIKALCVLHNFVRKHDGIFSNSTTFQYPEGQVTRESDRNSGQQDHSRPSNHAIDLRNRLCQYFLKPYAALPWQDNYTVN